MAKIKTGNWSIYLIYLSIVAVILSAVGYLYQDIWLASTQWLLMAGLLAIFGLYFKGK
jgi:hypothetical protein